ncbi:MAG TPA: type II secretion system F family protein [Acidimicrobiia bacterium]|nr:type II secretion system F family protein [Acidimicrobiia bacterium]
MSANVGVVALAVGWGCVAAAPVVALANRVATRDRARELGPARDRPSDERVERILAATRLRPLLRQIRVRRSARARDDRLTGELGPVVDLVGVAVGAGLTPYLALRVARRWCGPAIGAAIDGVFERHELGGTFDDALRDIGRTHPPIRSLTDTVRTSTRLGSPIAPALARLASEHRRELRLLAETRARKVPVRLLFPLVFCVLPAFTLLTVAPAVLAGFGGR